MSETGLEDRAVIQDLFTRYCCALDNGEIETVGGCFTMEAILRSPVIDISGHDEIRAFASRFAAQRAAGMQFRHMVSNIAVRINGNRAAATAYLLVLISHVARHQAKAKPVSLLIWNAILAWVLAAFFIVGSVINVLAPGSTAAEYQRWGYPHWFHFVTGALELVTAVLLALTSTRLLGAGLGVAVMIAAAATVVFHGEYIRAAPPLVILVLLALVIWAAHSGWPERTAS